MCVRFDLASQPSGTKQSRSFKKLHAAVFKLRTPKSSLKPCRDSRVKPTSHPAAMQPAWHQGQINKTCEGGKGERQELVAAARKFTGQQKVNVKPLHMDCRECSVLSLPCPLVTVFASHGWADDTSGSFAFSEEAGWELFLFAIALEVQPFHNPYGQGAHINRHCMSVLLWYIIALFTCCFCALSFLRYNMG